MGEITTATNFNTQFGYDYCVDQGSVDNEKLSTLNHPSTSLSDSGFVAQSNAPANHAYAPNLYEEYVYTNQTGEQNMVFPSYVAEDSAIRPWDEDQTGSVSWYGMMGRDALQSQDLAEVGAWTAASLEGWNANMEFDVGSIVKKRDG